MRTLANPADYELLARRFATVAPSDQPQWGKMNACQMLCHVADTIRTALGEKQVSESHNILWQTIIKWAALWFPRPWPHNVATRPELDQCALGITSGDFNAVRRDVLTLLDRYRRAQLNGVRHPFFGPLTQREWMRLGWLHNDHHLRQFGR